MYYSCLVNCGVLGRHCLLQSTHLTFIFTASFRRRIDLTRLTSPALLRFVVGLPWRVWRHLRCFVSSSDWLDAFDVTCTASFRRRIDLTRLTSSALLRFVVGLTWRVWHSSSLLYSDCIIRILLQAVLWVVQCSVTDCLCLCLFVCLWVCLSVCGCVWMTANVQVTTRWGITTGPTSFKWHNSVNMRFVYMKISGNIDDRMVSLHIWK